MRPARLILDPGACGYHCTSRVVGREFLFAEDQHKEKIKDIILAASTLKGAFVLNFVVMSNHIHILAQMPEPSSLTPLTEQELIACSKVLYSKNYVNNLQRQFRRAHQEKNPERRTALLLEIFSKYEDNRGDLSDFMKEVKERISKYINKCLGRKGTLWENRFDSVVAENTIKALLAVSTYIDLNPIRAGIVDRVEDYRWCGYSAALAGQKDAQQGFL